MAEQNDESRLRAFARIFLVMFVVSVLFQLLMVRDEIGSLGDAWSRTVASLKPSLGVALIAAGVLALLTRRTGNDDAEE